MLRRPTSRATLVILCGMIIVAVALVALRQGPPIEALDRLAKARDADTLTRHLAAPLPVHNPFAVLKTGGPYGTGRFGWKALELDPPGSGPIYVVFSTSLSSEDIGELVFERVGNRLRYVSERDAMGVRIVRHSLGVEFKLATKSVAITDRVAFESETGSGWFIVRMSPYLKVDSIRSSDGKAVEFVQAGGVVALAKGAKSFAYDLEYGGAPNLPQFAGSFAANEAQLTNDYWYPMIARLPAPYDLTVVSPPGWTAIGQGERLSAEKSPAGVETAKFRMDMPVVYYSLSSGPFTGETLSVKNRRFSTWSQILPADQLRLQNELNVPVMTFLERTLTPYPFSGFGILVTSLYGGGALEAYSFATWGEGILPIEEAHEPAHTWFGGMINNTYLRSLWNESFAVYLDGLYQRGSSIGNPTERRMAFVQDANPSSAYLVATCADSPPEVGPAVSDLGYGKGAAVLQMLESEVGESAMVETMRQWLKTHPKGKPGEWEDYEAVVAKVVAKQDLKWFFDQWLRRKGWPKFGVSGVRWTGKELTGVTQFHEDPYRLTVDALLQYQDGRREYRRINLTQTATGTRRFTFAIPMVSRPVIVSLDPWRKVLRDVGRDEEPVSLRGVGATMKRYIDPKRPGYLTQLEGPKLASLPSDLNGVMVVGHPETLPAMADLCKRAGFTVKGNKLTYQGTTVNLDSGGAMAVVELGNGRRCAIGLGKSKLTPQVGRARLAVFDGYGRFLRGVTIPKTSGGLTYQFGSKGVSTETDIK